MSLIPILLLLQIIHPTFNPTSSENIAKWNFYLSFLGLGIFLYLAIKVPGRDSKVRPTSFHSSVLNRKVVYGYNHLAYTILFLFMVITGFLNLIIMETKSYTYALYFWVVLVLTLTFTVNLFLMGYGIFTNTTPS